MKSKSFFGVLLILAAVLLVMERFNVLEGLGLKAGMVFPVFFLVVGLSLLIRDRNILLGGIVAWLSAVALADNWLPWADKLALPGILVVIGLELLFGHLFKSLPFRKGAQSDQSGQSGQSARFAEGADSLSAFAAFGGVERRIQSQDFKGGSITAMFGAAEIDLTEVVLKQDAVLELNAYFGGIELRLPAGLRVRSEVNGVFGGVEHKRREAPGATGPILILRGTAFMGGIEIY